MSVCAETEERTVPAARGTERLADLVDHAVETGERYRETVDLVVADGEVTRSEMRLLSAAAHELNQALAALPGPTAQVDIVMVLIGSMAGAGAITPWVVRKVREAWDDLQRAA